MTCGDAPYAMAVERFVGYDALAREQFQAFFDGHLAPRNHLDVSGQNMSMTNLLKVDKDVAPLLLRDWATNEAEFRPMAEATLSIGRPDAGTSPCGWEDLCFCGSYVCHPPAPWQELPVTVPHPPVPSRVHEEAGL